MSSDIKTRIQGDLNQARKDRDKFRTLVLSTLLSEIKNREIDGGSPVDDEAVLQVVSRAIKQRRDAADQMRSGGREELAVNEEAQAEVLKTYLPEQLSEDEVRALVRDAIAGGADQMGPLMGVIMPKVRGRFDGKEVNRIVREEMGA
ncbi:MAG: GatB/YqeY domain-containing protein [Gemmatimonadota bacterium]|nr:GatB/YqeY domain-containing protein [Gemmatimonadota bacterium]